VVWSIPVTTSCEHVLAVSLDMNTKTFSAIVGMALISLLAAGQFRTMLGAESQLASTSTVLLAMTLLSGLVALATSVTTVGLVVKASKQ
jgi:hypothetical protein